jgi:hypothetical protein
VGALEQGVDALDLQHPRRIRIDERELAAPPALDLVLENARERRCRARLSRGHEDLSQRDPAAPELADDPASAGGPRAGRGSAVHEIRAIDAIPAGARRSARRSRRRATR